MGDTAFILYSVAVVAAALAFLLWGIIIQLRQRKLKSNGVFVTAEVTGKNVSYGGKYTSYFFFVAYSYEGVRYEEKLKVSVEEYGAIMVGGQIPVMFLAEKPEKCYAQSYRSKSAFIFLYVIGIIFFITGMVFMIPLILGV